MYNRGEIDPSQPLPAEVVEIIHGALPSNVIPQAQAAPQPQVDAFGRPVSQPASTPNPFGTPNPAPPAPFGTPNPFGQSNGANPLQQPQFGTPQTQSSAPFGQSPAPFGQSAFGTPQQQNPFNAQQNPISPFVQQQPPQAQQPSPFGGFQQQAGPFGQPQQMATPPPSSFNNFDQGQGASNPSASASAGPERLPHHGKTISYNEPQFSDPGTGINPPAPTYERKTAVLAPIVGEFVNILTQKKETIKWADPSPYCPGCPVQHPHIDTYSTRDPATGKFSSFKGYPVEYKEITEENPLDFSDVTVVAPGYRVPPSAKWPQGLWIRIQFPNGPPAYNPETETSIYNAEDEKIWEEFNRTQKFPNDELPYNPPARELCHWAF